MQEKNYLSGLQIRNTLAILQTSQNHDKVKLKSKFAKAKCSSLMVSILYDRIMIKSLSSARSFKHTQIRLPDGVFGKLGTKENFQTWLTSNKYQTDMNSEDLLEIGAITGWHSAWRFLIKNGFVRINGINKVVLEYPVDGKLYSLDYASVILKGILKKESDRKNNKEESQSPDEKSSEPKDYTKKDDNDVPFWEL